MLRAAQSRGLIKLALAAVVLLPLLALCWPARSAAQGGELAPAFSIYLPAVRGKDGSTSQPTPSPAPGAPRALFVQALQNKKIAGAQIKVDAQGGTHLAYYDAVPLAQGPGATYAYCPPPADQCGDPARWSHTPPMGDLVDEVQLQLTPDGRPRLLIGYHATAQNTELYLYGECDRSCTAAEEFWSFVAAGRRSLGVFNPGASTQPKRSFALDAQGHPGFVLYDADYIPEPDHAGGYYLSCQASCTEPESWVEARFTLRDRGFNEIVGQPVLQYAPDGHPVILAELYPLDGAGEPGIYYFRCGQNCGEADPSGWSRARVAERFSGPQPSWDLDLDAQGRPRVSYFKYLSNQDTAQSLFYLWCDADCAAGGIWRSAEVGLPQHAGIGADLELDAQGRPRVAYLTATTLGYAWCDSDCATAQGWQHKTVDTDEQMTEDYPLALPTTCKAGIWDGAMPSLALDPAGSPRIAYDASYQASCQFQNPTDPSQPPRDEFVEVWHSVRAVLIP